MAMVTNSQMIGNAINGANICLHELQQAANNLQTEIQSSGIGTDDEHYQQLLGLVSKCIEALQAPQSALKKNIETLDTIKDIVIAKERHII